MSLPADPILRAALSRPPGDRPPCSVFTAEVLAAAYDIPPGLGWYEALNIYDRVYPWSPVGAAAEHLGSERVTTPRPGRWHLCQGWRVLTRDGCVPTQGPRLNGHAWLWWALTPDRGWALESSEELGIRWAGAGADCGPGDSWAERIRPYTAGVRVAVLPLL